MIRANAFFCLCLLFPITVQAERYAIAIGEFPPYVSEALPSYGFIGELTTSALEHEGHTVEFHFYPWRRAYLLTQLGEMDATLPWSYTQERNEQFLYSQAILNGDVVLFFNKGKKRAWQQLDDLSDLTFGSILGYNVSPLVSQKIEDGKLRSTTTPDETASFKMLNAGRFDVVAQDRNLGFATIKTLDSIGFEVSNIEIGEQIVDSVPAYLVAGRSNHKSTVLIDSFNSGLTKMIESGEFQKLLDKHDLVQ
ncbi:substrate-binding periplasmic protein [Reinekea sp.]|jgi:polar amino acid transport system substrate-binding protein|uniref:substrate-binding periplasmic protein n=1 Tax=Reinekea sp. TaxID=1970455 RepID=UPI003989B894